ncbi:endo-1,4-beta-xylanase [Marinactinospora rubrisoli]|uniref:Beta-xylanase n=1 Tax=Marinactinospora rubrisoli TaxID=2715399 RepID=A0ABW2KHC1_9ACTN
MERNDDSSRRPYIRRNGALLAAAVFALSLVTPAAAQAQTGAASGSLREHAQARGVQIGAGIEAGPLTNEAQYRDILAAEFNAVTPGNEMKWESVEPQRGQYRWGPADQIVAAAEANGQQVRGHTLVWHSQLPSWVANGGFGAEELRGILRDHIEVEAGRYAGRIYAWDVVNEPFNEDGSLRDSVFYRTLGEEYIADAFRWAREADPNARLYINDYNVEGINAKSDALYELVRRLREQGVPIDGVGLQGHFILGQVPGTIEENLRRFADLGVDVAITELDIRIPMPADAAEIQQQAREYESVLAACLAVSRCTGVTVWGITDRHSWIPGTFPGYGAALPYDEQYRPKPAYHALHDTLAAAVVNDGGTSVPAGPPGAAAPAG